MRLAWITDPHLDFLPAIGSEKFGEYVKKSTKADAVVITGDIAESHLLSYLLLIFAKGFKKPVYFVLGNHDFYRGSFEKVNQAAQILHESETKLVWLNAAGIVELTPQTALVGHGGWYDARSGDPEGSRVVMSDFALIEDFQGLDRFSLIEKCRSVAASMVEEVSPSLVLAASKYKHVLFATHVPPFREACWHRGVVSDPNWLPWFTNLAFGAMLADIAFRFPQTHFTALCGHTHSQGTYRHLDNLLVLTGHSQYNNPRVCKVFNLMEESLHEEYLPHL